MKKTPYPLPLFLVTFLGLSLSVSSLAGATGSYISEYFDYGDTIVNLDGLGGGSGWAGDWQRTSTWGIESDYTKYQPSTNLSSAVNGYENSGNVGGSAGGATRVDRTTWRSTGALDGTIWISFLLRFNQGFDNGHSAISFNPTHSNTGNAANMFSVRPGNSGNTPQNFKYNGESSTVGSDIFNFSTNQTYLMMVRIVIDEDGDNDRLDIWTHVADASSITALGTPDFSRADADAFGSSLTSFGVAIRDTRIDAIRISNAENGFDFVTTGVIPEPGTSALLMGGAVFMVLLLRRRRG